MTYERNAREAVKNHEFRDAMKLYVSSGALLVLAVVYLPGVLWLLKRLWPLWPQLTVLRLVVSMLLLLSASALPLADVFATSMAMKKLCPTAGVVIKRSVKVEGYLTDWGGADLLAHGYKYIESREGSRDLVVHTTEHGVVKTFRHLQSRYEPVSRYEFAKGSGQRIGSSANIEMDRSVVRDRVTGKELGYSIAYNAYAGWLDRQTIARFGKLQWRCPVGESAQELAMARAVLLPN